MSKPLPELLRGVQTGLAARDRDPLSFWHFSVESVREALALFSKPDPIQELHGRGANGGGKTENFGGAFLAMVQKRPELDGVPLPQWRGPVAAKVLSLDYNEQKAGAQQTLIRLLGNWPYHAKWKGDDILSTLRVQPMGGSSDESTWSTVTFHSEENKRAGVGRADIVWADEPPEKSIWQESRKAAHANRAAVRLISETPTIRRLWHWLKDEYGDPPRNTLTRTSRDWAEIRWSLIDGRGNPMNRALTRERVNALMRQYWGPAQREKPVDPIYDARVHGDYIDASGTNPLNREALAAMLAECVPPQLHRWEITREVAGEDGLTRKRCEVMVEVLEQPVPGAEYYLNVDPSMGRDDGLHDPGAILVSRTDTRADVALFEGYIGSYGLGQLAAGLARQYNLAWVDPEANSGWYEGVLRGLSDAQYGRIVKRRRVDQEGREQIGYGFITDRFTRPAMFEALQDWSEAYYEDMVAGREVRGYAPCRFARVIQQLMDIVLDGNDKPIAAPGLHDEFAILKGQSLRQVRPVRHDRHMARSLDPPRPKSKGPTMEELIAEAQRPAAWGRHGIPRPRAKSAPRV